MESENRQRMRLARAVGEFWFGGAGPTHGQVDDVVDLFAVDIDPGSKRDKVTQSISEIDEGQLFSLTSEYFRLLSEYGYLEDFGGSHHQRVDNVLASYGWSLQEGRIIGDSGIGVSPQQLPDVPAAREHVGRIERAILDGDDAQLLGSSKELLESVSKLVLKSEGIDPPAKFPGLVTKALETLKLHPKSASSEREDQVQQIRTILGGLLQIALAVNELRRDFGTGHGRATETEGLDARHVRLAAGAAVVVATLILDTYEDPAASWRQSEPVVDS
jgi:hypothetical protein